jgi:hypothetical protein
MTDAGADSTPAPPTAGRAVRLAAVAALAGLVAASAWLLTGPGRAAARVPTASAEQAAAAHVAAGWREGDVVRIDPYWYTGPRQQLAESLPGAEFPWFGFDLRSHPDPLHLLRFRRLWVIAAYEALDRDAAAESAYLGLPLVPVAERRDLPDLRVSLYELPADGLRFDLLRQLGDAEVVRQGQPCRWNAHELAHRCGAQTWRDVFVAVKDVGDATRQVIYAEPHPANTPLTIRYPAVPMDGPLVFHSGFSIEGTRRTAGADTRVRLLVDDEVAADWIEPRNAYVWRETVLPARGGTHALTVEISAPEVGWRQLCLDGAVLTPEGARALGH